jgi:hypothetical protein
LEVEQSLSKTQETLVARYATNNVFSLSNKLYILSHHEITEALVGSTKRFTFSLSGPAAKKSNDDLSAG